MTRLFCTSSSNLHHLFALPHSQLMTSLHQRTWRNQKIIHTLSPSCLLIYLSLCPCAQSFLMFLVDKLPCSNPFRRTLVSCPLNSKMLLWQFSTRLHHYSPSPSLLHHSYQIQSCCHFYHLRKPLLANTLSPAAYLLLLPFSARILELVVYISHLQFLFLIPSWTHFRQICIETALFLRSPMTFTFPNQ